jgi:hypothetical protein
MYNAKEGVGHPARSARKSRLGPFGVVVIALLLALTVQTTAYAAFEQTVYSTPHGELILTGASADRLAICDAALHGPSLAMVHIISCGLEFGPKYSTGYATPMRSTTYTVAFDDISGDVCMTVEVFGLGEVAPATFDFCTGGH